MLLLLTTDYVDVFNHFCICNIKTKKKVHKKVGPICSIQLYNSYVLLCNYYIFRSYSEEKKICSPPLCVLIF